MRCCEACFDDAFLKEYIRQHGRLGTCQYCRARRKFVIEASELQPLFTRFIRLYQPADAGVNIPIDADVLRMGEPLATLIQDQWEIFSEKLLLREEEHDLLEEILTAGLREEEVLDAPAVRDLWTDDDYMHNSLLDQWHELADELKNPEHHGPVAPNHEPTEDDIATAVDTLQWFEEDVGRASITLPVGSRIFRARLGYREREWQTVPFPAEEMGAPPPEIIDKPGRANAAGVAYFYGAQDEATAIAEKRPATGSLVSIATCITLRELRLLDLPKGMRLSSPFEIGEDYLPSLLESCELFNYLDIEFSRPLRHNDDVKDYLPTQFFAEWTKDHRYEGILYTSAMSSGGINVVLFDPAVVRVDSVRLVRVDAVEVSYHQYTGDDD